MPNQVFQNLKDRWPSSIVARSEVARFSGGLLHPRTLANLDCLGQGPQGRLWIGRMVAYPVDNLLQWMNERARFSDEEK